MVDSRTRCDGREDTAVQTTLKLGRITQRTTPGSVADVLRTAILDGTLKPGSPLRETQLAAEFHVSRAPLREALAMLADDGLVERIPYRGAFVAEVGAEDIAEIASLRKRLEPYAIELAKPRLIGDGRAKVVRALDDMAAGADNSDAAATICAHMSFHRAFYELSGHQRLRDLWQSWEAQLQLFFSADHQSFEDLHVVVAEHRRLLTVIDSGDPDAVAGELDRHVGGGLPEAEAVAAAAKDAT
jgi:DNA-binding GntR family transcriptional regulator